MKNYEQGWKKILKNLSEHALLLGTSEYVEGRGTKKPANVIRNIRMPNSFNMYEKLSILWKKWLIICKIKD